MKLLKKTISATLALAMVTTSLLSVAAVDNTQQKAKYSAYSASYVNDAGELVNNIDPSDKTAASSTGASSTELPSKYNSADYGYVTSVKHQGTTSTCWAHAAMAACESSMIVNNGYDASLDLSELFVAYARSHTKIDKMGMLDSPADYNFPKSYFDVGGGVLTAVYALAGTQGVVKESANYGQFDSSKMHYTDAEKFDIYNKEAWYSYSEAIIKNVYEVSALNPDLLKEYIMKYGAGSISYVSSPDYYNKETGAYYCYSKEVFSTTHAVTIVGWDDNYPKENCTVYGNTPENDGAWLIKNSYGTEQGIDGYNWISYEDNSIIIFPAVFFELSTNDKQMNIYQYDELCGDSFLVNKSYESLSFDSDDNADKLFEGGAYMSNMFTAQKDNETLKEVSFYTSNEKLDYTIEIYTGVEGITDPTNGTLKATVSGEDLLMGYHTIELPEPIPLNNGEKFSVVINIKDNQDPSRGVFINIDTVTRNDETKISDYGESFVSTDGKNWEDLKASIDANMRIKAFTDSNEEPAELKNYYDSYEGKTREVLLTELKATLEKCNSELNTSYKYSNDSISKLMEYYNYAKDVYNNPDIFLAIDFFELNNKLNNIFENMESYSIEDSISRYYNNIVDIYYNYYIYQQWYDFQDVYNSVLTEANNVTLTEEKVTELTEKVKQAYFDFMMFMVFNNSRNPILVNYGDVDNNDVINISDATAVQMLVSKLNDSQSIKTINCDVNNDGSVSIKDATNLQMYISKMIEYLPVYELSFNKEVDKNIDFDTAVAKLKAVVSDVENYDNLENIKNDPFTSEDFALIAEYNDAKKVLENPENYNRMVISYKERCLRSTLETVVKNHSDL